MPSKKSATVRFAVGTPASLASSVWRVWTLKNDIYLGATQMLNNVKVSLHESGQWRIATTTLEAAAALGQEDRALFKWARPAEMVPGWIHSISIVIPSARARRPFADKPVDDDRVLLFPMPSDGNVLVFTVFISSSERTEDEIRAAFAEPAKLVAILPLKNGQSVCVVLREMPTNERLAVAVADMMHGVAISPPQPGLPIPDGFYARAVSFRDDEPPTLLDVPLGLENLRGVTAPERSNKGGS